MVGQSLPELIKSESLGVRSIPIFLFIFTFLGDLKGLTKGLDGCLLQHK